MIATKFFLYGRQSVDSPRGESIENQLELCRDYIFANYPGAAPADLVVYQDQGFSGKSLDRPQFQRMLGDLDRLRPQCLVCYRLDRVSRSVGDFAGLIEALNAKGVAFICIREKFDTSTPMGKAMLYIASVFAQLERETIAQRVRDNMLLLARTGRWLGGQTPTGFGSEQVEEVILDGRVKRSCRLSPRPEELEVVELIYRRFQTLQSLSALKRELDRRGLRSRWGKEFSLPALREILQNPVYCAADPFAHDYFLSQGADVCFSGREPDRGLLSYNKRDYTGERAARNPMSKWILAPGRHPALVSGAQWASVQALLGTPVPRPRRNRQALLSGALRCARCGEPLLTKGRSGREGYDYLCRSKLRRGAEGCSCPNLNGPLSDQLVWQALCSGPAAAFLPAPLTAADLETQERRELVELLLKEGSWDGKCLRLTLYGTEVSFSERALSPP